MLVMRMEKKPNKVEDYFSTKKTTFWALLKTTKKWKEIYNQKESRLSLVVSIVIVIVLCVVYSHSDFSDFMELINTLVMFGVESSVGMLGFIISGLAIFTGTITNKLVKSIDSEDKIDSLIGILFSFYFIGAIVALNIVVYLIVYIFLASEFVLTTCRLIVVSLICAYLYIYTILYSVSLLGTCIRLFFVSYKYSEDDRK